MPDKTPTSRGWGDRLRAAGACADAKTDKCPKCRAECKRSDTKGSHKTWEWRCGAYAYQFGDGPRTFGESVKCKDRQLQTANARIEELEQTNKMWVAFARAACRLMPLLIDSLPDDYHWVRDGLTPADEADALVRKLTAVLAQEADEEKETT